jgi:cyclophilin family peptidyl-prolyl cis-trans isomerase
MRKSGIGAMFVASVFSVAGCIGNKPQGGVVESKDNEYPQVKMETSMGTMVLELWPDKAPKTVENFLRYVDDGFYDGLIFHRVIGNFMIQGGGFTTEMRQKPARETIVNEARADVSNRRGTLAMARTPDIHSASSQFFVNVADNTFLDHRGPEPETFGYAVFGQVVEGMDVADQISKTPRGPLGAFQDVPLKKVVIVNMRRVAR